MCFILNYCKHLGKFDSKSDENVFLGYSNNSKAFRVYNMRTQNIVESANVIIDNYQAFADYSIEEEIISLLETPNVGTTTPKV